jgi:hypothetical protein
MSAHTAITGGERSERYEGRGATVSKHRLIDLSMIRIRLQCKDSHHGATIPLDRRGPLHSPCPACSRDWAHDQPNVIETFLTSLKALNEAKDLPHTRRPPVLSSNHVWSPGATVADFPANCLA